jgi:hypothetical protein
MIVQYARGQSSRLAAAVRGDYHRLPMGGSGDASPAIDARWLDWVNANLGGGPDRAQLAAEAAQQAIVSGNGLNAAVAAATNRWVEHGHGEKPFWEMTFWGIWFGRRAWIFGLFAAVVQVAWLFPLGWIAVLALTPLPTAATFWHFYVAYRLSKHGIVAPGVLVDVTVKDSDGDIDVGTYRWDYHGPHLITQTGSTSQDVLILFDPAYPRDATVINRSLMAT